MKQGFTTGSCASAAARGAVHMLLTGEIAEKMTIMTPAGIEYEAPLLDINVTEDQAWCAVKKISGDDPDVTAGMLIYARASYEDFDDASIKETSPAGEVLKSLKAGTGSPDVKSGADYEKVVICAGFGIGRVTKPGLSVAVGRPAINPVPLKMIRNEVLEECDINGYDGRIFVQIYAPEGKERAKKTFNERLGIEGGISIIGTSGIVEPMSLSAIKETIRLELNQKCKLGFRQVALTFGNYGRDYIKERYGYDLDMSVKISNFVGDALDMAMDMGFDHVLLTGHIGKMVKLAGGIMNTHSSYADCRMELLAGAAMFAGGDRDKIRDILDCVSTDAALDILSREGILDETMAVLGEWIGKHLEKKVNGRMKIDHIVYSNERGELIKSKGADEWFISWEQAAGQKI
ncbi:MAG: cobalamin biosynthesis protein CbiD [Lachnospiraceae bacterium]|nr:cobalamin biosynthesis protein CbiD [Lachnospiraceae bacterium]